MVVLLIAIGIDQKVDKMIKQAVILAAGNGSRMKNSAKNKAIADIPKPLLPIKGKPMIEYKITELVSEHVDVCIVINPVFQPLFRDMLSVYDLTYAYQDRPSGTAHALYCAKNFINQDLFLVVMGDDLAIYDIRAVLSLEQPTVFGFGVPDVNNYGVLAVDKDGYVEDIIEKQRSGSGIVNTGVYIMPKRFFDYYQQIMPKNGERYLTDAPRILLQHNIKFRVNMLDNWYGINTYDDLVNANLDFAK